MLSFVFALTLTLSADLCPPRYQALHAEQCATVGPGHYAASLANARIPADAAPLATERLTRPDKILENTFARVTTPEAPLFASPDDALAGNVKKALSKGFLYVQLASTAQAGDQVLYQIRSGEYIRAGDVQEVTPSSFQGVALTENPVRPFGWLVLAVRPSTLPGLVADKNVKRLPRYRLVQIYAIVKVGAWNWYMIGPHQWVEQRNVGVVDFNPPPEGVTGKWVQVNLYEQTMAAYEDGRMVYASLVSSGLDKWATQPGLFQIWAHLQQDRMAGSYEADHSDYYSLEAVPYVMYFDGSRALHGEYWHDKLGFKRSHGCVNLAPLDARWLYDWSEKGTTVWVYDPSKQTGNAESVAEGP
jgi:hypothetical protein